MSVDVDPDPTNVDSIALEASGGAIRVTVHGNEAILSFGEDAAEADHIANAYEPFGGAERQGNSVIAWTDQPTTGERDLVRNCLSG